MKYTFRYSVAYGIQFYKMYLKNIKNTFHIKISRYFKNKSPPSLIDWPAVLHMLVKVDWVDRGDICCRNLWAYIKIVPLLSPY